MANEITKKRGPLPACVIDRDFIIQLWNNLGQDGEFTWQATVGTGGDLLGKLEKRPEQVITDFEELVELLESLPRIDSLNLVAEIPNKGVVGIVFKNYTPAGGILAVSSEDDAWREAKFDDLTQLFYERKQGFSIAYSRIGFGVIQTFIPLTLSFIIVMFVASFIPSHIRHSDLVWWITAGTLIITLRLAYTISDKMIIYTLKNYPYIRWLS